MAAVSHDPPTRPTGRRVAPASRAAVRIVSFIAVAAATSFAVGLAGNGSGKHWLFSVAGSLEFWGVVLVASPELDPYRRRLGTGLAALSRRTNALVRRAIDWVRVTIGRPRTQVVSLEGIDSAEMSETARLSVSVDERASTEEKVAFLLRRDEETQERLADLDEKLNDLPERWRGDIEAAAGTLRQEQERGLVELRGEHLTARLGGVVFLVVGLGVATWGNLL